MATLLHATIILIIIQLSNGLQTFQSSVNEYRDSIISCDDGSDCKIICDEPNACKNTKINCPIGHACDITCSATKSCAETLIIATHSSSLIIHDCATGEFTCKGISIYLPPNNNGIPRAIIDGADNGLSQGGGINNTFDGENTIPIHFYAIYGWNDINIVNYSGTFEYQGGIMHCTINYNSNCPFNNNSWECENTNHICSHTNIQNEYPIITSQFIDIPHNFILDKSDKTIKTSGSPLWYIANILIISIISLILIFMICVLRAYRIEKELISKCDSANNELNKLQKLYDAIPNTNTENDLNTKNICTAESCNNNKRNRGKTISDEHVAVEILSTQNSMMSIDVSEVNNIKSPANNNNCLNHSPITPNDEWDKKINSLKSTISNVFNNNNNNNNENKIFGKTDYQSVLKLSDIPTPNSIITNIYNNDKSITKTMSLQSCVIIPPKISHKSENSSMVVAFHEMNNDISVKYEHDNIFIRDKLSVLNDANEDECD